MAIARITPTCPFCGKAIAKAVCNSYEGVPSFLVPIGDSFIRWEYFDCYCDEAIESRKQLKQWAHEHPIDINKIINKSV